MRTVFIFILFLKIWGSIYSQNVGIGISVPDASSRLDVSDTERGILIPRVALIATNNSSPIISAPATSLLVYNTATSGSGSTAVSPGYYYWDGNQWVRLMDSESQDWKIHGNTGTNPTSNFIGTIDAADLQFRTGNINRMRIMNSTHPTVGIGTIFPVMNIMGAGVNYGLLHVHDGGTSTFGNLILSTHSTASGSRAGIIHFAATQVTNDRRTAGIESFITAVSGGNISGDLRFFTNDNNVVSEKMRMTSNGQVAVATITPTANYLMTINPNTNLLRNGISIPMSNATSTAFGVNVTTANANARGFFYANSSNANGVFYGTGSELSSGNIVSGYTAYRNSSGLSYGIYGITGTNAAYDATNANTWAGFFQGRVVISGESSPTSSLGTDLEIRNTTPGAGNPTTLSLRQSTTLNTQGSVMNRINFGDNSSTNPQASILSIRDSVSSGVTDLPTALSFYTTLDNTNTMTERMRINNRGNVRIGFISIPTTNPAYSDNPYIRLSSTQGFAYFGNFNCDPVIDGGLRRPGHNALDGVGALVIGMNRKGGGSDVDFWNTTTHTLPGASNAWDRGFYFRNYNNAGNEALIAYLQGNGQWFASAYNVISDKRTKSNIQPYQNVLHRVLQLNTYSYDLLTREFDSHGKLHFSNSYTEKDFGFIAQELYQLFPEVVHKPVNEKNQLWAVKYDKMTVILTKALQEQNAIIQEQQKIIEKQSLEIQNLRKEFEDFKRSFITK